MHGDNVLRRVFLRRIVILLRFPDPPPPAVYLPVSIRGFVVLAQNANGGGNNEDPRFTAETNVSQRTEQILVIRCIGNAHGFEGYVDPIGESLFLTVIFQGAKLKLYPVT